MLQFICYFMPSFISINIHKKILKDELLSNWIIYFGIYVTLNNLLTLFFLFLRHFSVEITFSAVSVTYCFKYLLMSTIFSIITPYIIKIIIKNIEINVEVKKNEQNKKRKKIK